MGRDSRAGRGKRVTERNCAALPVELLPRNLELALDGACLSGERFVHLDDVHVVERETRRLQCLLRRGNRSDSHDLRIDAGKSPRHEPAEWLEPALGRELPARDHERTSTVADAGGISCCHDSVLAEYWLELRQPFHCRFGTHVLVLLEHLCLL